MAKREHIKVDKRTITGKKVRKLRREGILPTNIYGKELKSIACQVPLKEFKEIFKKVHETGLIDLEYDSKILPVLIHNVQFDPRTQEPLHADFYKVDLKQKIKANVPVVIIGESPAVLDGKGLLLQQLSEVEVEALPTDLPEKIEVNIEGLKELNEEITISNIKAPEGVTVINESSQIVAKIGELVTKEAEEQAKAEEAAAAEAKTAPEGATPTETQTPTTEPKESGDKQGKPETKPQEQKQSTSQ